MILRYNVQGQIEGLYGTGDIHVNIPCMTVDFVEFPHYTMGCLLAPVTFSG